MKIAHVSDIHVLEVKDVSPVRFLGKRLTGGANLLIKRGKSHGADVVEQALRQIAEIGPDHTVVTGDLSNLALHSEFLAARRILTNETSGPRAVSVIPGNHDYYTLNSVLSKRFNSVFEAWMTSDLPEYQALGPYPYVRFVGDDLAVIGLSSCIPSPPFFAVGRVGRRQRRALDQLLADPRVKARTPIVALHHNIVPPEHHRRRKEWARQLIDSKKVLEILTAHGVGLAIHGHTHQYGFHRVDVHGQRPLYISEAGSTSVRRAKSDHYAGKFKIYTFDNGVLRTVETFLYDEAHGTFIPWKVRTLCNAGETVELISHR